MEGDWAEVMRERVQQLRLSLLNLLAREAESSGDVDSMLSYLEQAIQADPYDEERYVRGARALASLGRARPALRLVERACLMLAELRVRPGGELTALRGQLTPDGIT